MNTKKEIEQLKSEALKLTKDPGVYIFYNERDVIIYVGKAKNLKNRVSSYFNENHDSGKTRILIRHIKRFEHIPRIEEYSIGHSIVSRAVLVGFEKAVREMISIVQGF